MGKTKRLVKQHRFVQVLLTLVLGFLFAFSFPTKINAAAINISGSAKVLNTNAYLDFTNYNSNVKVDDSTGIFSGYAWLEDTGWVAFGTADNAEGPVAVSLITGAVTGKAKVLSTSAYLDFTNNNSNVDIDLATGVFTGYVWSEDVGWLNFADTGVTTASPLVTPTPTPTETPTPTPTTSPSTTTSSSSNNSSPAKAPECTDQKPGSAPSLFQIDQEKDKATLYFVPSSDPVNKYYISYGTGSNAQGYGVGFDQGHSTGAIKYTINDLSPNTTYYFKVRAGNGCMPGNWGNTKEAKTTGQYQTGFAATRNQTSTTSLPPASQATEPAVTPVPDQQPTLTAANPTLQPPPTLAAQPPAVVPPDSENLFEKILSFFKNLLHL